jgi:adenosylhomocysteine nucleosidase
LTVVVPHSAESLSSLRIAIFAATGREARAVQAAFPHGRERNYDDHRVFISSIADREYWLIRTGIGHENAGRAAAWWLRQQPFHLVVSTGFACALVPATIGALLIGREARFLGGHGSEPVTSISSVGDEVQTLVAFMNRKVPPEHSGPFVSIDQIVVRAEEKRSYARVYGAVGLDMESAALAIAARRSQVPFMILRTVSDLLDEDLPLDFNLFLRPSDWPRGISTILMAPGTLWGLRRLHRQSRLAAARLTQVFRAYAVAITSGAHNHRVEHA